MKASRLFKLPQTWRSETGRDLLATVLVDNVIIVFGLLLFRLVAHRAGPDGFGQYQLARGAVSMLLPLLLLGLPLGLAKFVARATVEPEGEGRLYLAAAIVTLMAGILIFAMVTLVARNVLGHLLFGHGSSLDLLVATSILTVGLACDHICVAYLRGTLRPHHANALRFLNFAVMPLLSVLLFARISYMITSLGFLVLLTSVSILLFWRPRLMAAGVLKRSRAMLSFSARRALGDVLAAAFFVTPTVLTAHVSSVRLAGYVGLGTSVVIFVAGFFSSIGTVLLPRLSRSIANRSVGSLRRTATGVIAGSFGMSVVGVGTLLLLMPVVLRLYAGPRFVEAAGVVRLFALGAVPYSVYVASRSVIDAASDRALNSRNLAVSYVCFWVFLFPLRGLVAGTTAIGIAFWLSALVLGLLTVVFVGRACANLVGTPETHDIPAGTDVGKPFLMEGLSAAGVRSSKESLCVWLVTSGEPLPIDGHDVRVLRTGMFAAVLLDRGHRVVWWSSTVNHATLAQRFLRSRRVDVGATFQLQLLHGCRYTKSTSGRRLISHYQVARNFARLAPSEPPPDVVVCALPEPGLARAAVEYAAMRNIPSAVDVRDLWPDVIIEGIRPRLRWVGRLALRPMDRSVMRACTEASAIFGPTTGYVEWALKRAGRVQNEFDEEFPMAYKDAPPDQALVEAGKEFWRSSHGIEQGGNQFVVCFFGQIGRFFDLATVIEAAKMLGEEHGHIQFVLCGNGEKLASYREMSRGIDNVVFPGRVGAGEIWALMRLAAVGLAPYKNGLNFVGHVPNKPVEYLSGGLPVVSSLKGTLQDMLARFDCGVTYPEKEPLVLAAHLAALWEQPERRLELAANAARLFRQRFTAEAVFPRMARRLEDIVAAADLLDPKAPSAPARPSASAPDLCRAGQKGECGMRRRWSS